MIEGKTYTWILCLIHDRQALACSRLCPYIKYTINRPHPVCDAKNYSFKKNAYWNTQRYKLWLMFQHSAAHLYYTYILCIVVGPCRRCLYNNKDTFFIHQTYKTPGSTSYLFVLPEKLWTPARLFNLPDNFTLLKKRIWAQLNSIFTQYLTHSLICSSNYCHHKNKQSSYVLKMYRLSMSKLLIYTGNVQMSTGCIISDEFRMSSMESL